jgi:hypothetical protein
MNDTRDRDDIAACVLLYAILAAQVADWALTVQGLEAGATELNPIMREVFARGYWHALALKLTAPALILGCYLMGRKMAEHRKLVLVSMTATALLSAIPIPWNLYQMWKYA